ncbi:hypothetical protein Tco_0971572 [Tanacetum coccineum]
MEEGRINNKLKTELKKIRTQIIKLQKKQLGQKDKIAFAYYRISDLEQIIEKIQAPAKIKEVVEIVHDKEEVAIDAIPLAVKPLSVVDWKIHKEENTFLPDNQG